MPLGTTAMVEPARDFYHAVAQQPGASPVVRLEAREALSIYESKLGNRSRALQIMGAVIPVRWELAAANADAFLPSLAGSLNNLANLQSEMGQRGEALAAITEAVEHYRALAASNPDAFLPNLALSHGAWGAILQEAGRPTDAAEKFAEGVRLITPLALRLPQAHVRLAFQLAHRYSKACDAAGIASEPALMWPLELAKRAAEAEPPTPDKPKL